MGERYYRKLCLGVILSGLVLYVYLFLGTPKSAGKIRNAFFVNTPGCRIAAMDVMNPTIAKYTVWEWNHPKFQLSCPDLTWFRTEVLNQNWYLKLVPEIDELLEEYGLSSEGQIDCHWSQYRSTGHLVNTLTDRRKMNLEYPFAIKIPKDVLQLRVLCINLLTNASLYDDAFYFIKPPPEKLLHTPPPTLRYWDKKMNTKDTTSPISVMVVGLDSVSHLNFLRQMPKTNAYIRHNTSHVEFWGFNKVGLNTIPNLMPMLTGMDVAESQKYWDWETKKLDDLPLIWKDYKAAGYNTSFGEDWAPYSMFYFNMPGFSKPSTDHSFHDLMSQVFLQSGHSSMPDTYCVGEKTLGDVLMEMNYKLLPHMQRYPFFSFYWWANGVHEFMNTPRLVDGKFEEYFTRLHDAGIMNNTIILFMSDHGLRWGRFRKTSQGMAEDCQPFLSVLYPAWMRKKYPMATKNLAGNAHSLITTFDLYETLKHILHPSSLEDEPIAQRSEELSKLKGSRIPRGVSLFLPIPAERTCNTSHVPSRFCLCHKQVAIATDNPTVKLSANIIVNSINKLLEEYPVCIPLQLESIVSAYFAAIEHKDFHIEKGHKNTYYSESGPENGYDGRYDKDIVVRLQTKPGKAYFEAMLRMTKDKLYIIGDVVRVGGDVIKNNECIQNPVLEPFCYCAL